MFKFIGDAVGAIGGYLSAKRTNRLNREIAGRQMDFQREMSSSAYQRSMADMRKAGLNPILAYKQGGASTGAGAGIPAIDQGASARQAWQQSLDRRLARSQLNLQSAQSHQVDQLASQNEASASLSTANSALAETKNKIERENLKTKVLEGKLYREILKDPTGAKWKKIGDIIQMFNPIKGMRGR
jgi:hypothetical protein